jgi:hypothetical protein
MDAYIDSLVCSSLKNETIEIDDIHISSTSKGTYEVRLYEVVRCLKLKLGERRLAASA